MGFGLSLLKRSFVIVFFILTLYLAEVMVIDPDEPDIKAPYEPLTLDLFPASALMHIRKAY